MSHALERTSPKGEAFIGYCTKCGMHDLPMVAGTKPCPMDDVVSDEQALLAAINGPVKCACAEHAKTARPGKWECLECGTVWNIPSNSEEQADGNT